MTGVEGPFDFAFDWELLHHIYPGDRPCSIANVARVLVPGGKYLSVCFHEDDPQCGGSGKYRTTQIGTVLYFSSEEELRELFSPNFIIRELRALTIRENGEIIVPPTGSWRSGETWMYRWIPER